MVSDQVSSKDGGRKRHSLIEAAAQYEPIVPLPGISSREPPGSAPDHLDNELSPPTNPRPVPVLSAVSAGPIAKPVPSSEPELAVALPAPAAAPSTQGEARSSAVPATTLSGRSRTLRLWPWIALLALIIAAGAGGAFWLRTPQPHPATHTAALPHPAAEAPPAPPANTPEPRPAGSANVTPEPISAAPPRAPAPMVAEVPAPATSQPDTAATPPAPTLPPMPTVPESTTAVTTPRSADRRVVIRYRRASSVAGGEAARLADQLRPLAAQVDLRAATAIPRLPTIRYFHPEDAAAAQELATALRHSATEWRVQARLSRRPRQPLGRFEVWLPDS